MPKKINPEVYKYIIDRLKEEKTPDEIVKLVKKDCKETVSRSYIYTLINNLELSIFDKKSRELIQQDKKQGKQKKKYKEGKEIQEEKEKEESYINLRKNQFDLALQVYDKGFQYIINNFDEFSTQEILYSTKLASDEIEKFGKIAGKFDKNVITIQIDKGDVFEM